jgi:hypothetical protein
MARRGLTQEQKQKFLDWLNERWVGDKNCPVCHHNRWTVSDDMVSPNTVAPNGGVMLGGPSYPVVLLICKNCANTLSFNAPIMGIVESEAKQEEEQKQKEADAAPKEAKSDG